MKVKFLLFAVCLSMASIGFYSFSGSQAFDLKASVTRGKEVYITYCLSCHMENGEGIEDVNPPLAKSDYMMADKKRSIKQIIEGATGEMKVKGKLYTTPMAAIQLNDEQVSDVLNYARNSWGNKGGPIKPDEVKALRK